MTYKWKYEDMDFSKDGSLDELIALDRYAIPVYDGYKVSDTVVAIIDEIKKTKRVCEIVSLNGDNNILVRDREGIEYTVKKHMMHKPLETKPVELWSRWAKGGASIEKEDERAYWEDEFSWLLDGFRYSLGGRIQLSLGQEFVTGTKANLTSYNCYVSPSPIPSEDSCEQFLNVIEAAYIQASIHRVGGGDGINISTINTVKGYNSNKNKFVFYLSENHKDSSELKDRIKLGKFKNVTVVQDISEFDKISSKSNVNLIHAVDSVKDGLFDNIQEMVRQSYEGRTIAINFDNLRERDAIVHGVNGRSSGAVSWMELFVVVASLLQQEEIDCVDFAEIFSFIVNLIQQGKQSCPLYQ